MMLKLLIAHLGLALITSAEGVVIGSTEHALLDLKGPPTSQMRVGAKAIYYWEDAEITVVDGKVSSIKPPRQKAPAPEPKPIAAPPPPKASPPSLSYLDRALAGAAASGRLLLIKYGRPECGNCLSLQRLIDTGRLPLGEGKFNILDVNCDLPEQVGSFDKKYGPLFKGAPYLPFVVVADPSGRAIASHHGGASQREYADFIKTVKPAYWGD